MCLDYFFLVWVIPVILIILLLEMSANIANNCKPGISGQEFDKCVEREDRREDDSTFLKVQQSYWEAKQSFISKLRRKEDDCIVASDAPLDAKLEVRKRLIKSNFNKVFTFYSW